MSDLNLLNRIRQGLTRNTGKWVKSHVIYAKMQTEGYSSDAIFKALNTISHEPPYAMMQVQGSDHRTLEHMGALVGGYYYTRHPMTDEEIERMRKVLEEI